MRYATLPLAILISIVAAGCAHRHDPVRVTVQNPPPPPPVAAPPTVVIREEQRVQEPLPPVTTVTQAAPADGSRYRVDDVEVIYSQPLGAYMVTGYNDYYYLNGRFYRYDRGRWEYAPRMRNDTRWVLVDERDVPNSLVIRYRR